MTKLERLAKCGRCLVPGRSRVAVYVSDDGASFGGIQRCGLVWVCPVCSAKIRQARAVELERLALAHVKAGGGLGFLTLTVPHIYGMRLKATLHAVNGAYGRLCQSRAFRALSDDLGVVGRVCAVEVTHGKNGWHPHLHVLVFLDRPLDAGQESRAAEVVTTSWRAAVLREGLEAPSDERGARWEAVCASGGGAVALARYLTKVQDGGGESSVGAEMARGDLKRGRSGSWSMVDVLRAAVAADRASRRPEPLSAGHRRALALWWEYEQDTRRAQVLRWSPGLKKRLCALADQQVDERTDEQIAEQDEPAAQLVVEVGKVDWQRVVTYGAEGRLLLAAMDEREAGVLAVLRSLRRRDRWERRRARARGRPLSEVPAA